jgi:hypothetical protein
MKFDRIHVGFNFPDSQTIQIFNVYIFSNTSDKTIVVEQTGQSAIPFIQFPAGAVSTGYEDAGMGGTFVAAENGFAIPPSDQQYGIVAYYNLPYPEQVEVTTEFILPVDAVTIFAQPGIEIKGDGLAAGEMQDINGFSYNTYNTSVGIAKDDGLTFTISGKPASSDEPVTTTTDKMDTATIALIAAGVLGIILIGAGVWMFMRDRKEDEDDDEDEDADEDESGEDDEDADDETAEVLMDAINALDDQYKAGNISQEVYEERRAELKAKLKKLL